MAVGAQATYACYGWESALGTVGSPALTPFGRNCRTTDTKRRNLERIYDLDNRNARAIVAKNFEGTFSADFMLSNGWWLRGAIGSLSAGSIAGSTLHTFVYSEDDNPPSLTVDKGTELGATDVHEYLLGCVINTATITSAVGEVARVRLDGLYQKVDVGSTLPAAPAAEINDPMTFAGGVFKIGGTTVAQVQNVELAIENNYKAVQGLGSIIVHDFEPTIRNYTVRATFSHANSTYLAKMLGSTTAAISNPAGDTTMTLRWNNGSYAVTNSGLRQIQINLGSCWIDEHTMPQEPDDFLKEDITIYALSCGSAVYETNQAIL